MNGAGIDRDPLAQFQAWFRDAAAAGIPVPEAMALATATQDGAPSVRMVLLKGADERGFAFFTNLESRKGLELAANPRAALLFHWSALGRQVRVEGGVVPAPREETEAYFRTRPLGSRIAAIASPQSRPLADRAELERLVEVTLASFPGDDPPLPGHWGGFRVQPEAYEFWQHGEDRLHDRIRYERADTHWSVGRLAP
jgi:pyridoxamine 5'-phosphate oxidase